MSITVHEIQHPCLVLTPSLLWYYSNGMVELQWLKWIICLSWKKIAS